MSESRPKRSDLNFDFLADITLKNLAQCFENIFPGSDFKKFASEVLTVVALSDDPALENPFDIAKQFFSPSHSDDTIAHSPLSPIRIACAYNLRAQRSRNLKDFETAWSYMADARFWTGVAISGKGLVKAYERTTSLAATKALQTQARSGAQTRSDLYEPVRNFAFDEARKRQWHSRREAARAIAPKAIKLMLANEDIKHLHKKGPDEESEIESFALTIAKWLGKMPDADFLFNQKRKHSAKK